jgi:Glycosyltransferase sugar-binding region containing DXD motif
MISTTSSQVVDVIPQTFHYYWADGDLPKLEHGMIARNMDLHPHWDFKIWSDENLPEMSMRYWFDHASDYTDKVEAFKASVVRYELLYQFGGVWSDADVLWLKDVSPLTRGPQFFTSYGRADNKTANNAVIGSEPDSPLVRAHLDAFKRLVPGRKIDGTATFLWLNAITTCKTVNPTVYPVGTFHGISHDGALLIPDWHEAYAFHLWNSLGVKIPKELSSDVDFKAILSEVGYKG